MAEATPWQAAARRKTVYKKTAVYTYDPYNFSHVTTSNGTNPPMVIPCTGPGSAGAIPPSSSPQVAYVVMTATGTNWPEMGSNLHQPV